MGSEECKPPYRGHEDNAVRELGVSMEVNGDRVNVDAPVLGDRFDVLEWYEITGKMTFMTKVWAEEMVRRADWGPRSQGSQ
jgi:hypothetical protein